MIDYQEVLDLHQVMIVEFGGGNGVRDDHALRAALDRPFSGFGDTEFYPSPEGKAAAVFESIIKNHPFIDGNKRTGYLLLRMLLMHFGRDLRASQDDKYDFVIRVASGTLQFPEIEHWVQQHAVARA